MRYLRHDHPDAPGRLVLDEGPLPVPGPGELLVRVSATAVNRADLLQRKGKYPPPPGESPVLGLELAGEVAAAGLGCSRFAPGSRVCGLLAGGGYAEYALLPEGQALPLPPHWTFAEAAAVPEAFLTAYQALFAIGGLQRGEAVLIHAGASGVGTAAIQLARLQGAEVLVTASAAKHAACAALGAAHCIDYRTESFSRTALDLTGGQGVQLIVDLVGAPYWQDNLRCLALDGRLVLLSIMGGAQADSDLALILRKRLTISGSTLRNRSRAYKAALTRGLEALAWEAFAAGQLRPVIDRVLDWQEAEEAHRLLEANATTGKVVLRVRAEG